MENVKSSGDHAPLLPRCRKELRVTSPSYKKSIFCSTCSVFLGSKKRPRLSQKLVERVADWFHFAPQFCGHCLKCLCHHLPAAVFGVPKVRFAFHFPMKPWNTICHFFLRSLAPCSPFFSSRPTIEKVEPRAPRAALCLKSIVCSSLFHYP